MFESLLIRHCAPVLAGIKTANMFSCRDSNWGGNEAVEKKAGQWNRELEACGVSIEILKKEAGKNLIYVYRKSRLKNDLMNVSAIAFLKEYGYDYNCVDGAICQLKSKISFCSFPHEIGLFLGYPLGDIKGFIENKGCNYKLCGFWKVYCNEECTAKCFEKYKKCFAVYNRLFEKGRSINDMVVWERPGRYVNKADSRI